MKNNITIKNEQLTVEISTSGAQLQSIKSAKGSEYLWQGDERYWGDRAPVLFPVCGCLYDGKYTYQGKTYYMNAHGFARKTDFTAESVTGDKAVLLIIDTEETRECYPFGFEMRAIFELLENKINVTYRVNNKTDGEIYFSVGAHEGYLLTGDYKDYSIVFEGENSVDNALLSGPFLNGASEEIKLNGGEWTLDDDFFAKHDTMIIKNIRKKSVLFHSKNTPNTVRVDFDGFDNLLLWKEPGGNFLCIEPWCGLPDYDGKVSDISTKEGIIKLEKDGVFEVTHTITVD